MINQKRLFHRLLEIGRIGMQEQGGITRLSYTKEEKEAKELLTYYMLDAGLEVRQDAVGNLIGRKEGGRSDAPVILTGSHFDTVPQGGMFDGVLGILAAIEVLQCMNEKRIETEHPIEVIAFVDEEGARFGFGMVGSRAISGKLRQEDLQFTDSQGIALAEAMRQAEFLPDNIADAAAESENIKAYIELHIEQGKVLENRNLPVGVVSGIAGHLWIDFRLIGESGHAGATPMKARRDPMTAAAKMISYIDEETKKYPNAVATIGKMSVLPGGVNVIPREVEFTIDLRDIDETVRNKIEENIVEYAQRICKEQNIELSLNTLQRVSPVKCSKAICDTIERACIETGQEIFTLISGAGHDGMQLKDFCPIGMIFIRSRGGVSHNADEWSSEDDCGVGADVLYHTILELAERV
ncbi:Zn-dependent hydrolase [Petroclostridium sp. X23]|nr:Zn-dependent hydrolase [Petroclostridium sp. X23]WHH61689.1 Zn-dependent hydrolase [Petroclostridium sp. X23]